jgi:hypothetical protein
MPLFPQRYNSISHHDIIAPVPKKLSSLKSFDALQDIQHDHRFHNTCKRQGRSKRKSQSSFSLKLLVYAQQSSYGSANISKHSNPLLKVFEENLRRRELLLLLLLEKMFNLVYYY